MLSLVAAAAHTTSRLAPAAGSLPALTTTRRSAELTFFSSCEPLDDIMTGLLLEPVTLGSGRELALPYLHVDGATRAGCVQRARTWRSEPAAGQRMSVAASPQAACAVRAGCCLLCRGAHAWEGHCRPGSSRAS